MKTESRVFNGIALFLFLTAAVYAVWSGKEREVGTDWIGSVALVLSGLLCLMCGLYFSFVARRIEPRPEDRLDGEIADGAGDVGFFSPGSYWPFGVAISAAVAGLGVAFWYPWLIAIGVVAVLVAAGGLLFEYYTHMVSE
jgi:hypothetical protein